MKIGRSYFNDPDDLSKPSNETIRIMMQTRLLDSARRMYKRQDDPILLKRANEIRKLLDKISEMQTIAVRSLVLGDFIYGHVNNNETWE